MSQAEDLQPHPASAPSPELPPDSGAMVDPLQAEPAGHSNDSAATALRPWTSSWARDILVSVIVSAFIIVFLYQPVRVEGTSMLPMLQDEDRLFINKIAYRVGDIHHLDVVVFLYPHDHSKSYIKRVIAVGGDRLRIDHGQVYVNGEPLKEGYVPIRYEDERSQPETVIPPHEYWVMGDHRNISSDSRDFGPVARDLIYGKAAFVYWPVDQMGVVR
ncbi:signal peptidase I [Granulicella aggregans]|uniref:Signal peptidase I n=1 Tax=Granulicella aggregans TaxID=474949 RepID=A0A7W7ZFD9_9BACT|nr:signal peptidase I [Granulicella aggregans]